MAIESVSAADCSVWHLKSRWDGLDSAARASLIESSSANGRKSTRPGAALRPPRRGCDRAHLHRQAAGANRFSLALEARVRAERLHWNQLRGKAIEVEVPKTFLDASRGRGVYFGAF